MAPERGLGVNGRIGDIQELEGLYYSSKRSLSFIPLWNSWVREFLASPSASAISYEPTEDPRYHREFLACSVHCLASRAKLPIPAWVSKYDIQPHMDQVQYLLTQLHIQDTTPVFCRISAGR